MSLIRKKIADNGIMWLIEEIMNSSFDQKFNKNLFEACVTGIPIGNLTSQLFANVYLNELDALVKRKLRLKHYVRYVDDFLILDTSKTRLLKLLKEIGGFLSDSLSLSLPPEKAVVFLAEKGIDFLGYRVFANRRLVLASDIRRFFERVVLYRKQFSAGQMNFEKFIHSLESWLAYAKFGEYELLHC